MKMDRNAAMYSTFAIILIISGGMAAVAGSGCGHEELMRCSESMPEVLELSNDIDKEKLEKTCLVMQTEKRCVNDYTARCMNSADEKKLNRMYEGVYSVMSSICRPGAQQDEYLRNAKCDERGSVDFVACSDRYERALAAISEVNESDNLRRFCCSFQQFVECSVRAVKESCGENHAEFVQTYLKAINVFNGTCPETSDNRCRLGNSGTSANFHWLVALASLTALIALPLR